MKVEAISSRLGELRLEDVRAALGRRFADLEHVDVLVAGAPGQMPSAARVAITSVQRGAALHTALACPRCSQARWVLLADGQGGLACKSCSRYRTRRQMEWHRRDFKRYSGRQEDLLLRALKTPGRLSLAALERVAALADRIVTKDAAFVDVVRQHLNRLKQQEADEAADSPFIRDCAPQRHPEHPHSD